MWLPLATLFAMSAVVRDGAACPSPCTCDSNTNSLIVNCAYKYLGYIPTNLPNTTVRLDLSVNIISELKVNLCDILPNLEELILSYNRIVQIPDGYFEGCNQLNTLYVYALFK